MNPLKHLPLDQWPEADHTAFAAAYAPGDIFDETGGPGAHLAEGTRRKIRTGYRRWLGYLDERQPAELAMAPADRITRECVRGFIEALEAEVRLTTVATIVDDLHYAARLIAPERDWAWLRALATRLAARAQPMDRFDRLVPPWLLLDLGIEMMDHAVAKANDVPQKACDLEYRDGLLIALISEWPLRRRSIAALTISRHLCPDPDGMTLLLYPEDTKSKRAESFRVPDDLLPYVRHYLGEVRPRLPGSDSHDGFWASNKRRPICPGRIYDIVRGRVLDRFGKDMNLHDVRRAAATHIAMEAPDKLGLIPGVLQHTSPEVAEKHYNLARSVTASRRFGTMISELRRALPRITKLPEA